MPNYISNSHTLTLPLPAERCHMLFTPAGEELWIDDWKPHYIRPADGRTEAGMVFTTGLGNDFTVWTLIDFDRERGYSRYARVTPALRTGFVEVICTPVSAEETQVRVSYTLTALTPAGAASLEAYEGQAYVTMIEGWRQLIEARLPALRTAALR
jgi:hypothetical protein